MTRTSATASDTEVWPALGGMLHHLAVLLLPPCLVLVAFAWTPRTPANQAALGVLLLLSLLLPAAWLWIRTRHMPEYQPRQPQAASLAFAAMGAAIGASMNFAIGAMVGLDAGPNQRAIERVMAQLPLWAQLVLFAGAAPWIEELVFRRLLLGRFLAAGAPALGLVVTSVLFGLMHVPYKPQPDPWIWSVELLLYSAMGAMFGAVYWRTRRLSAAFVAHALINALAVLV